MLNTDKLKSKSAEVEELNIKDQGGVWRNTTRNSRCSVSHVRTDCQLGSLTLGHLGNTLIPSSNDLQIQFYTETKIYIFNLIPTSPFPRVNENACPLSLELSTLVPLVRVNT